MTTTIDGTSGITTPSGAIYNGIASGTAVASTSGTSITYSSLPSWVKRITIMLKGFGTSGTSIKQFQLGSGSATTTGYVGSASAVSASTVGSASYTTGFAIQDATAANRISGNWVFTLENASTNTWICSGTGGLSTGSQTYMTGGFISLSGTLDRVIITTVNGTDTMAAGEINILYE